MKKQWIALFLILLMVLNLAACGSAEPQDTTPQTQPATNPAEVTEPQPTAAPTAATEPQPTTAPAEVTEPQPTTAPTVVTEPAEDFEIADVDSMIFAFPLLEEIGGATLETVVDNEDGTYSLVYTDAGFETLEEYLYCCSTCGLYAFLQEENASMITYLLYPIGVPFFCKVVLDLEGHHMYIILENTEYIATPASMEAHLPYYEQELSFPAEYGKNVFPQFNASIGEPQPMGYQGAEVDYLFDGAPFWCEMYLDVSYAKIRKYVDEMILCGFDVRLVAGQTNDKGALTLAVLHFSNGDADVAIKYDFEDQDVSYYTEGGTIWTLLTGEDYYRYIPQK